MRVDSVLNVLLSECKWMIDNYPPVLFGENLWASWFDNLSEYDITNLRMNRSGIEESKDFMFKELYIWERNCEEYRCINKICMRLVTLLARMDGKFFNKVISISVPDGLLDEPEPIPEGY